MGDFFRGWRRKTGCVTLLMALVVLAAWGRSHISAHTVTIPWTGGVQYQVTLRPTGFCFHKTRTIAIGNNETLSCRDGAFIITGRDESYDGNQSRVAVESQPDSNIGINVLGFTVLPTVINVRREHHHEVQSGDNAPRSNPNGLDEMKHVVSITGATTVIVDCGETVIPYWYLITPLTLISAYFLLMRPVKDKNVIHV